MAHLAQFMLMNYISTYYNFVLSRIRGKIVPTVPFVPCKFLHISPISPLSPCTFLHKFASTAFVRFLPPYALTIHGQFYATLLYFIHRNLEKTMNKVSFFRKAEAIVRFMQPSCICKHNLPNARVARCSLVVTMVLSKAYRAFVGSILDNTRGFIMVSSRSYQGLIDVLSSPPHILAN